MLINFLSFCTKNNLLALFAWAGLVQVVSLWWVTAEKFVYRQGAVLYIQNAYLSAANNSVNTIMNFFL